MSFKLKASQLVIDLHSEEADRFVVAALVQAKESVTESIGDTLQYIARNAEVPDFYVEDLEVNFRVLDALDEVINYFGGDQ